MARDKRQLGIEAAVHAIQRTQDAQTDQDETFFYASAAESIWWLTMLDETLWGRPFEDGEYETVRGASKEGVLLLGLRYARNRQVHDTEVTGMQGNPLLQRGRTKGDGAWMWRSLEDEGVPAFTPKEGAWGRQGETVYREALEGHEVLKSLKLAVTFLRGRIKDLP